MKLIKISPVNINLSLSPYILPRYFVKVIYCLGLGVTLKLVFANSGYIGPFEFNVVFLYFILYKGDLNIFQTIQ